MISLLKQALTHSTESQIMINILDLHWRWRVAAHRTGTQEAAGVRGTVAPTCVKEYDAPPLHLRRFHVIIVHHRIICLVESHS